MEVLLDALRRVGAWLFALAVGGVGMLLLLGAILPPLASTATAFIATPGGLIIAIFGWRYIGRRRRSG